MKINPQSRLRSAAPPPVKQAAAPSKPADGYGGTVPTVTSAPAFPAITQASPTQGLVSTLSQTLGKLTGLGGSLVDWLSGRTSQLEKAQRAARDVLALGTSIQAFSDEQLKAKTQEFRQRLKAGASLDDLLVEAYAVARETARRATGLSANDKQVLGAALAHQGCIVEMKTGEGKTLMEVMPAYLHALSGDGVHIITANDYLAQRDRDTLEPVFIRLGLSSSVVSRDLPDGQRQAANQCDVVYGTASEFGFQYLEDHLTQNPDQRVSRDLSKVFALVDEADKVLLDEANTPLVISSNLPEDPKPARVMATVVKHLKEGVDFQSDKKTRQAWLTEEGLDRVEKILGLGDLYSAKNEELVSYLQSAVQARALFQPGVHYLNTGQEVVLIDEFTGRPKPGHRFSEGLHQAIEASEGLVPGDGMLTMASITYPNYLRMYGKLAGMTGTGLSSRQEFGQVYGLDVQTVPTHKPVIRQDLPDLMFNTGKERDRALADEVARLHKSGRPVLLGTRSIERSEDFSRMLKERGIPHQVLNAKNIPAEADIIARAGHLGAVTVATNMAGRGTDIKLGADANQKAQVVALGGLAVLGSERHEARRIDEQLAGRAGRQGDPGSSQFYLSKEDELFRLHLDSKAKLEPEEMVRRAQQHADDKSLELREFSLKYDGVVNKQRGLVYAARDAALDGIELKDELPEWIDKAVERYESRMNDVDPSKRNQEANYLLGYPQPPIEASTQKGWLKVELEKAVSEQGRQMGSVLPQILSAVYLRALDREWMEQISRLDELREGNRWEASQEENPLQMYEKKAHEAFESMLDGVAARTLHGFLSARPMAPPPPQ
ncbi:MAG: preprotein translocase subunit SecA [Candidatus Eremiobacteraeota bacterium]|nr:preprotein translocase subunit SecA [Candidatus Eremiobacteraeota bacterium]MCW5866278.1 preprotein translocase subunit SecA [Candidatus Eremiobacteraeota bacterium]